MDIHFNRLTAKWKKRKGEKTACRLVKFFIEKDLGKDYGIYK